MSISAPPGRPSIMQVLSSSFRDAAALVKSNRVPAAVLIGVGTIGAVVVALTPSGFPSGMKHASPAAGTVVMACIFAMELILVVLAYYAIAASIRTVHAGYRMTGAQFFGILGYSLLAGLLTGVAEIAFVVPALWIAPKLMLMPYVYALGGREPFKITWNMTTGYYWQTIGMFLLTALCTVGLIVVAALLSIAGARVFPVSVVVLTPLVLAVVIWALHVHALVSIRWTWALMPRANAGVPQTAAVPV